MQFLAASFLVLLATLSAGFKSSTLPTVQFPVNIANKTSALEVVTVHPGPLGFVTIVIKNVSSKKINGYEVLVANKAQIRTDTSVGDWALSPGATHHIDVPVDPAGSNVTILAAMFTDGNIEGEPATVKELKQWRASLKTQLRGGLELLEAALKSSDVFTLDVLDRLESELTLMGRRSNVNQPSAPNGARTATDDLLTEIRMLRERRHRQGAAMQMQRLLDFKKRLERRIASL